MERTYFELSWICLAPWSSRFLFVDPCAGQNTQSDDTTLDQGHRPRLHHYSSAEAHCRLGYNRFVVGNQRFTFVGSTVIGAAS